MNFRALIPLLFLKAVSCNVDPDCDLKRVAVQLFEWPWLAVAQECEEFLGPKGFCAVQVFPLLFYCHLCLISQLT